MKTKILFITLLSTSICIAQVGIGTTSPEGALDIVSTNDTGVVIPRVSSINNVTDGQGNPPANGTLVYDLSKNAICFYLNQKWACMGFSTSGSLDVAPVYYEAQDTYFKASNTDANDYFGERIALSADGTTLAVASSREQSNATGINGNQADNSLSNAGAVYVFYNTGGIWSQQAYIKASNTEASDSFGTDISISNDGNTLAISASGEDSNATGINGNEADNSMSSAGAVYVFTRTGSSWSQQAYIKASNTNTNDNFGYSLAISGDGNTVAVGAYTEDSNATGINGLQTDNSSSASGATYVFTRSGSTWSQQAYIKASNTNSSDFFGGFVTLSTDGNTLGIAAVREDSSATGINGDQLDNSMNFAGAVYVFNRTGVTWSQQAYIKASNTGGGDSFGSSINLSGDGNTLVVGANSEDSSATGINGDQNDNSAGASGAAYVFHRLGVTWSQQAYIKASNTDSSDSFGIRVAISDDGNTLLISATTEDSNATGINGDQTDNSATSSGAAYVFSKSGTTWSQIAYVKATNTELVDAFTESIALNSDGNTLVVGAYFEDSNATGINGDQTNNDASRSGAVYMYEN